MARPRAFDEATVVDQAKQVFWDQGYEATAVDDLERATQLSRSSLYATFGSKQALFGRALDAYLASFVDELVRPMEAPDADAETVAAFFTRLAAYSRGDAASSGCLMVNSIAELEGRSDDILEGRGDGFRERLRAAFAHALAGGLEAAAAHEQARLLTATTLGVWLTARSDPAEAADLSDVTAARVRGR